MLNGRSSSYCTHQPPHEFVKLISSWRVVTIDRQHPMMGENRQFVTDEPVEFEKEPVGVVQDCRKITHQFRGIYRIYPSLIKETRGCHHVTSWTCKHSDLNRLCPKISLPDYYTGSIQGHVGQEQIWLSSCEVRVQCSRSKPLYELHFEGLLNFSLWVEGLVPNQDFNPRI